MPVDHFMPTTEFIRSINIVVVFFSVIIILFHRLYGFRRFCRTDDVDSNNNSIYYYCKVSNVRRTRPHAEGIDATARSIYTSLFAIRRTTTTVRLARLRGGTPLKSTSVLPPRAHRRTAAPLEQFRSCVQRCRTFVVVVRLVSFLVFIRVSRRVVVLLTVSQTILIFRSNGDCVFCVFRYK